MTTERELWAVVEVLGHRQFAGRCSEEVLAGQTFLRIDVYYGEPGQLELASGPAASQPCTPTTPTAASGKESCR